MKHLSGNGITGVTIHGHLPGLHMAGNEVLDNNIGRNNTVATRSAWLRLLTTTLICGPRASWWAARPTSPW